MTRWQNGVALIGTLLASGALLPLPPRTRVLCALLAIAAIVTLLLVRLRSHRVRRDERRASDVFGRIDRIRAERAGRGSRRRR